MDASSECDGASRWQGSVDAPSLHSLTSESATRVVTRERIGKRICVGWRRRAGALEVARVTTADPRP